ncbi:MAG: tRNA pseudouridine(55) synthase TruB [Bradymonadaceae bacterium]|nr:tRNA pseudouridine(55) synthase TruB [Lujinxingiaceae bacterium]
MDGLLLIDKPAGMTSFDVVRRVRRLANTKKVGHTGTLDPDATGLLPIVIGQCTKLANFLVLDQKEYVFDVCFGSTTDTLDSTGEVVATGPWEHIDEAALCAALNGFLGTIMQVPPAYSALKVNGKRAYELARKGEEVHLAARPIAIHAIELLAFDPPSARLRVACGSGTYVRSLARDLGEALGSLAHTTSIRRTAIGAFHVDQAHALDALDPELFSSYLIEPLTMLASVQGHEASEAERIALGYGQRITIDADFALDSAVIVRSQDARLIAVAIVEEIVEPGRLRLKPKRVFDPSGTP